MCEPSGNLQLTFERLATAMGLGNDAELVIPLRRVQQYRAKVEYFACFFFPIKMFPRNKVQPYSAKVAVLVPLFSQCSPLLFFRSKYSHKSASYTVKVMALVLNKRNFLAVFNFLFFSRLNGAKPKHVFSPANR